MKNFKQTTERVDEHILALINNADTDMIKTFFKLFVGKKTMQTFDDSETKNKSLTRIIHLDDVVTDKQILELKTLNERGAGIYMAINETDGQGRTVKNVTKVRAVFADLDGAPLLPTLQYNPTLIVESSPDRFHVYFFCDDMPLNAFTAMQQNIARIFNSDKKVIDLPRVLRVPGFYHKKKKPYFQSVIRGGVGTIFSFRRLVEIFPPEKVPQWTAKKYKLEKPNKSEDVFRGKYGAIEGERNQHIFRRACGMFKRGKDINYVQSEVMKEAMACMPPVSEREALLILSSAQRYAR